MLFPWRFLHPSWGATLNAPLPPETSAQAPALSTEVPWLTSFPSPQIFQPEFSYPHFNEKPLLTTDLAHVHHLDEQQHEKIW